jgi:branched-chain amino acid transport system permease protein
MLLAGSLFPSWQDFQPFLITGLALGAVYALSGVGMVVLYRATGVLYLAFGAVGAFGALVAWQLTQSHWNIWLAYLVAVALSALITLAYGMVFGSALAAREPLVKATATLGLTLILLGAMDLLWTSSGGASRAILLPTDNHGFMVGEIEVTTTQVISIAAGIAITVGTGAFLRFTKLGTTMRAMANDREITATLGVPVRRVEACAWLGCGVLAGLAGVVLADLVALDATTLTFLVISSLAAALIAQLRSIVITFIAALVIGVVDAAIEASPNQGFSNYHDLAPFVLAAIALLVANRKRVITISRTGI